MEERVRTYRWKKGVVVLVSRKSNTTDPDKIQGWCVVEHGSKGKLHFSKDTLGGELELKKVD